MERRVHREQFYDGEVIVTRWVVEGFTGDKWVDLVGGGPFRTEEEATEAMEQMASGKSKKNAKPAKPIPQDEEIERLREENAKLSDELDEQRKKNAKEAELNRLRATNASLKERKRIEKKDKVMRRNIRLKDGAFSIAPGDENE